MERLSCSDMYRNAGPLQANSTGPCVAVDGKTLCHVPGQRSTCRLDRLETAVQQLCDLLAPLNGCLRVWVDASLRYQLTSDDVRRLDSAISRNEVRQGNAGLELDPVILEWSGQHEALVISTDLFRNYATQYPFVAGPGRMFAPDFDPDSRRWTFFERHHGRGTRARSLSEVLGASAHPTSRPGAGSSAQTKSSAGANRVRPPDNLVIVDGSTRPQWLPDPSKRFDQRWWAGTEWSSRVLRGFQELRDEVPPSPFGQSYMGGAGWYRDPSPYHELRWWTGRVWSRFVADGNTTAIDPVTGITPDDERQIVG